MGAALLRRLVSLCEAWNLQVGTIFHYPYVDLVYRIGDGKSDGLFKLRRQW